MLRHNLPASLLVGLLVLTLAAPVAAGSDDGETDRYDAWLPMSEDRPLRPEVAIWTLLAGRDYSPNNEDGGYLAEVGIDFGIGNISFSQSLFPVVRVALGFGGQGYTETGNPDAPGSVHLSLNLLAGVGFHVGSESDHVLQFGVWFRGELAANELLLADGGPAFGNGHGGWVVGGFVRLAFRLGDWFSIPIGFYLGAALDGPRGITFGIDLASFIGVLYAMFLAVANSGGN